MSKRGSLPKVTPSLCVTLKHILVSESYSQPLFFLLPRGSDFTQQLLSTFTAVKGEKYERCRLEFLETMDTFEN